jgi:hypothetical protein
MASAAAVPTISNAFVYEDLVFKVQALQLQIAESIRLLYERMKDEKNVQNDLKLRSLIFVDPFGNSITNQYMDHEMINIILKKHMKYYVPKYLQEWIKIGTRNGNFLLPLTDCELKSTVSKYDDGHQFITCGEVVVWISICESLPFQKIVLRVILTDNMDNIKIALNEHQQFSSVELKLSQGDPHTKPNDENWDKGQTLKLDDTIISCKLYENNCFIMAKLIKANVNSDIFPSNNTSSRFFCRLMVKLLMLLIQYLCNSLVEDLSL